MTAVKCQSLYNSTYQSSKRLFRTKVVFIKPMAKTIDLHCIPYLDFPTKLNPENSPPQNQPTTKSAQNQVS